MAAFVAGNVALHQLRELPDAALLLACAALSLTLLPTLARFARARPGARRPWPAALGVVLPCLAALCGGFGYTGLVARERLAEALAFEDEGRDLRVRGVVASLPADFEGGTRFTFAVDEVLQAAGVTVPRRVALSWYAAGQTVRPAQRWELTVRLRRPHGNFNPGGFDAEAWMLEQDIRAQGTVRNGPRDDAPVLLEECLWRFNPLVDRARAALRERLQQVLAQRRYAPVIVALVMGDQGPIRDEDWALFNRTGISHLVSISGLHITMIAAAVALLAGALWRRSPRLLRVATVPTVRALAAIAGGYAYCLLAGWGVPAQRTLLMLGVVAIGRCWRVQLGAATILAAAALLVCLWDPWAVLAAGFWLSFGAVACIFLASGGRMTPPPGWRHALREAVRMQGAITLGQVPLTLAIFGQVSLVAPLANAVAIPLVSYLVAPLSLAGAGLCALGGAGLGLGTPLLVLAEWLFGVLAAWLQWLTQPSWSWFCLPMPPLWTIAAALAGCAWLLAPPGWPLRWAGLCWTLPMFLWPVDRPGPQALWVTALDVGQGMSLVLETVDTVVVFDTGPRYTAESDAGGRVLVPYLRGRGIGRVDMLVVSHQDADHAGGASSLLHALPVQQVWSSVPAGHRLLSGAGAVRRCEAGQQWASASLQLTVLGPPAEIYGRPRATTNERSCVVLAQAGAHRVLLTGDVPLRQERRIVAAAPELHVDLHVDLLVAPHHGSRTSSSPALLAATRPRWVTMQLGYRNRFGHPHPEVVQRYLEQHAVVVRSDENGAAQWRFGADGSVQLERWRIDYARYWHNQPGQRVPRPRDPVVPMAGAGQE
jgi:competence protein ComEC